MTESNIRGPKDLSYVDILNVSTDEAMIEEAKVKKNPIRPSGAGGCTRELAYKLMEYAGKANYGDNPIDFQTNRIFSSGHALEYDLIKQFRKYMGDIFQIKYTQQSLFFEHIDWPETEELWMTLEGSCDLAFWSREHKCLVDIKSKKDKFSYNFKSDWDATTDKLTNMKTVTPIGDTGTGFWIEDLEAFLEELDDPFFEANFLQLNLYATHREMQERGIDHAAIIQYNKNDQRLREVRFKPCELLADKVFNKFNEAIEAADKGEPELAKRDYYLGSIKCAFCDFKGQCWPQPTHPDEDPLKSYFKTLPKKFWSRDIDRLEPGIAEELEELHAQLTAAEKAGKDAEKLSRAMAEVLTNKAKTFKVKMSDGTVYDVREYKSPFQHIKVKKGKD